MYMKRETFNKQILHICLCKSGNSRGSKNIFPFALYLIGFIAVFPPAKSRSHIILFRGAKNQFRPAICIRVRERVEMARFSFSFAISPFLFRIRVDQRTRTIFLRRQLSKWNGGENAIWRNFIAQKWKRANWHKRSEREAFEDPNRFRILYLIISNLFKNIYIIESKLGYFANDIHVSVSPSGDTLRTNWMKHVTWTQMRHLPPFSQSFCPSPITRKFTPKHPVSTPTSPKYPACVGENRRVPQQHYSPAHRSMNIAQITQILNSLWNCKFMKL